MIAIKTKLGWWAGLPSQLRSVLAAPEGAKVVNAVVENDGPFGRVRRNPRWQLRQRQASRWSGGWWREIAARLRQYRAAGWKIDGLAEARIELRHGGPVGPVGRLP
jgi:hypothetical protein